MLPIDLDYQRRAPRLPWLGSGLLVLALLALAALALLSRDLSAQAERAQSRLEQVQRAGGRGTAGAAGGDGGGRAWAPEVRVANAALRRIGGPWTTLYEAVESTRGDDVALLALEVDLNKGTVKIGAEARHPQAMLDHVGRLMAQPVLGDVQLQSHDVQQDDPNRPVRFTVLARWRSLP